MDTHPTKKSRLENLAYFLLILTVIISPLIFVSSKFVPIELAKSVFITFGVLVTAIVLAVSIFKNKIVAIPRHSISIFSILILASVFLSTLFSSNISKSLFGQGFESGTASFIFILFLSALATINLTYKNKDRFFYIYGAIIASFGLLAVFHISRFIFGSDTLSLGILPYSTSTILGKWGDLAILSGLVSLISYSTIRVLNISKLYKGILFGIMAIAIALIMLVNYKVILGVLSIVFLFIVAYEYYISEVNVKSVSSIIKNTPWMAVIITLVFVLGFVGSVPVLSKLQTKLNILPTEVSLPWQMTLDITSKTIIESPILGSGPNRFAGQYLKYKPFNDVNPTNLWSAEFNSGFGLIPTYVVTQGILGLIVWILFLTSFIRTGYSSLIEKSNGQSKYFTTSAFFSSVFLWLVCLVYVPSHVVLLLTFVMSGVFVASLVNSGHLKLVNIHDNNGKFVRRVLSTGISIFLLLLVVWVVLFGMKIVGLSYFHRGVKILDTKDSATGLIDIDKAKASFEKAVMLDKSDSYYQALSEVNIIGISSLSRQLQSNSSNGNSKDNEAILKQISDLVTQAVDYSRKAIAIDSTDHYNYLAEARISEVALSLKVENAYENAKSAYASALKYNPYDPSIYLSLARLEVSQNKLDEAQRNIGVSLQLKPNYIDPIFLLSQIQVNQGQTKEAITSVQYAIKISPANPLLHFQLGLLQYNDKNYQLAIDSLTQALKLDGNYANAQYFLGLSYARLNKMAEAIDQFESLVVSNPDNAEVNLILSNLRKGRSPFNDAPAPIDSKPEKRTTLPIKEKSTAKSVTN
jgi:tetratricopeptide (TPR) repeat protein